jgi:hypothetical protein
MENYLQYISVALGGINLALLLKLMWNDIHELRKLIIQHLQWHMNNKSND